MNIDDTVSKTPTLIERALKTDILDILSVYHLNHLPINTLCNNETQDVYQKLQSHCNSRIHYTKQTDTYQDDSSVPRHLNHANDLPLVLQSSFFSVQQ